MQRAPDVVLRRPGTCEPALGAGLTAMAHDPLPRGDDDGRCDDSPAVHDPLLPGDPLIERLERRFEPRIAGNPRYWVNQTQSPTGVREHLRQWGLASG